METILATAFGRRVNMLRGESSELSNKMEMLMDGFTDGQIDGMFMLESKDMIGYCKGGKRNVNLIPIMLW